MKIINRKFFVACLTFAVLISIANVYGYVFEKYPNNFVTKYEIIHSKELPQKTIEITSLNQIKYEECCKKEEISRLKYNALEQIKEKMKNIEKAEELNRNYKRIQLYYAPRSDKWTYTAKIERIIVE